MFRFAEFCRDFAETDQAKRLCVIAAFTILAIASVAGVVNAVDAFLHGTAMFSDEEYTLGQFPILLVEKLLLSYLVTIILIIGAALMVLVPFAPFIAWADYKKASKCSTN